MNEEVSLNEKLKQVETFTKARKTIQRLMRHWLSILTALGMMGMRLRGANPGDEAVVVFNARLPESKALAEYYAQKRQVPANQVFGFEISTNEEVTRLEFRNSLQRPLAKALESRKLWHIASRIVPATNSQPKRVEWKVTESKIRYAVLCFGLPLRIAPSPEWKEEGVERLRPEMRRNEAAVDSELSLLPLIEQQLPLAGPLNNPVYGTTNLEALHPTNGVLMVSRLDGPNPQIARGLVDKALQAEADGLWGRAYFDVRNTTEPGYKLGDEWIRAAAEICRRLGFETVVDENPAPFPAGFPMSQIAIYIGWYSQDVSGPFAQPTVEFMPGAFAYHLHSYSAATLRSTNQFWVGPLLARGATATMGCVYEPFLAGTPNVAVFTSRFIFNGWTFGESALVSQPVLSWQTTTVGDPLYRPFGANPEQQYDALLLKRNKLVEWYYLRLVNMNLANGKLLSDCLSFLEQLPMTKQSAVLAEKLSDFYEAEGKPSAAAQYYGLAAQLDPSAQQRLRLLLTLGNKQAALEKVREAHDAYQKLLLEYPAYPDKAEIIRKLLPLARKLNETGEVEKLESALRSISAGPK